MPAQNVTNLVMMGDDEHLLTIGVVSHCDCRHEATGSPVTGISAETYQGLAETEVDPAMLYLEGRGLPGDYSKRFFWMKKAADPACYDFLP